MKKIVYILLLLFISLSVSYTQAPPITVCWKVYPPKKVEKKAEYPGGEDEMYRFIYKNILWRCGEQGFQGRLLLSFVVDNTGKIWDVNLDSKINPCFEEEIKKAIYAMPAWTPASLEGFPVCMADTIPIRIRLGWEETSEKKW